MVSTAIDTFAPSEKPAGVSETWALRIPTMPAELIVSLPVPWSTERIAGPVSLAESESVTAVAVIVVVVDPSLALARSNVKEPWRVWPRTVRSTPLAARWNVGTAAVVSIVSDAVASNAIAGRLNWSRPEIEATTPADEIVSEPDA